MIFYDFGQHLWRKFWAMAGEKVFFAGFACEGEGD